MANQLHLVPPASTEPRWFTHRWPWLLMLGPAIVVVAGSYTGYLAFRNQDPLVVGDYYRQGKAINQDLRRDRAATSRGMALALEYDAAGAWLRGSVSSHGAPATERVKLHLAHATQPEKDLTFVLTPDAQGRFTVALPLLERSRWQVLLEDEKRAWRLEGHWSWPAQRKLDVVAETEAWSKPAD